MKNKQKIWSSVGFELRASEVAKRQRYRSATAATLQAAVLRAI